MLALQSLEDFILFLHILLIYLERERECMSRRKGQRGEGEGERLSRVLS